LTLTGFFFKRFQGMGLFKKVGNFVGDIGKGIAKNAIAPLESVTGRDWNPGYKTKAGRALAVAADKGTNMLHVAPKAFADGFTGGRATKWANNLRKKENREVAFHYNEMNMVGAHNSTGIKGLDKGFNVLGKVTSAAAGIFGQAYAIAGAAKATKNLVNPAGTIPTETNKSAGQVMGVLAGLAVALLIKR
jgi:hypothetical protein